MEKVNEYGPSLFHMSRSTRERDKPRGRSGSSSDDLQLELNGVERARGQDNKQCRDLCVKA